MEREDVPPPRLRVQSVGEPRLHPGALVQERQRADVGWQVDRQTRSVLSRLALHSGKGVALGLRLDHARCPAVHVEQVVGGPVAGPQQKLPYRDAEGCMDVERAHALHRPARLTEQPVDVSPCSLFGSIAAHKSSSLRPFEVEDHALTSTRSCRKLNTGEFSRVLP